MLKQTSKVRVWPGKSYPLGATWDGAGVNFAVRIFASFFKMDDDLTCFFQLFSEHATKVELCLFDSKDAKTESHKIELPEYNDHVFHGYLPDCRPGQLYGYRVHGPYEPEKGKKCGSLPRTNLNLKDFDSTQTKFW